MDLGSPAWRGKTWPPGESPGASSSPRPGQLGSGPNPREPVGAGLLPEGRDGCLAGSPLARCPVPGLRPHSAAFAGLVRGCRARRPESGRALAPCAPGPDRGGAGAKLSLILGKTSAGKEVVERGGERRGRSIGARSSAPHLPRRLLAPSRWRAGDSGAAGGSHALPHP